MESELIDMTTQAADDDMEVQVDPLDIEER